MKQHTPDFIGLGYCGLDYLSLLPTIPQDDKVEIISSLVQGGGPAATATCAAAKLGAKTAFVGSVGSDPRGREIVEQFRLMKVDTSALLCRETGESPAAFCWTEQATGKRSIAWTKGSISPLKPEEIDVSLIRSARLLHLDGHQTEAAIFASQQARAAGVTVSLDAGTLVNGIDKLLELSDIIIASEKFAERYTGLSQPEESVKLFSGANCKFSAVTLGARGCVGFDGTELFKLPVFKVKVVDTTGAGDVFHGAFAYKYMNGGTWRECARFASAVSALKCTALGGRTALPDAATVENFINRV